MLFVVIAKDIENSAELRAKYISTHRERLEKLKEQGILKLAGPFTDSSGSLIIVDFESEEQVKEFIESDVFFINKVYSSYEIKPFKQVL